MKVAIMGAGAVGCYYGAMLARAGHPVTIVARPQHVEAVQERGLILETGSFTEAVRVDATADPSGVVDADIILFCVKSTDTVAAGREMAPYVERDGLVLSLQNGVDCCQELHDLPDEPLRGVRQVREANRSTSFVGPDTISRSPASTKVSGRA